MAVLTWVILTCITLSFFVYKLNVITQRICHYIESHYPDEYEDCHKIACQMGQEQKGPQIMLMESFHSGNMLRVQDPALQQLRQQLTRLKTLFVVSPFLLMILTSIVTYQ